MSKMTMLSVTGISPSSRSYVPDNRWACPDCHIGVELEYENTKYLQDSLRKDAARFWAVVADDSLRNNGAEFIFKEPLSGADLSSALTEMEGRLGLLLQLGKKYMPDPHYRTSAHVHIDVRDCTVAQYMNMILLGILFEPALFKVAGEERARNNFSLSSRYATGYFEALSAAYNSDNVDVVANNLSEQFKYTAINVTPPFSEERAHPKKGSLEFRHHRGTTDMEQLSLWINILMCLKKAATNDNLFSPAWMQDLSSGHMLAIMKDIFGVYTKHLVYAGMETDFIEGARLVQDVIHLYRLRSRDKLLLLDAQLVAAKQ